MNDNKPKQKWGKPKLIVLVRGDRQEGVLSNCKGSVTTGGWNNQWSGCWIWGDCALWCKTLEGS